MIRNLICINCPMGCALEVEVEDGKVTSVKGNTCKRGDIYARSEVIHPVRTITSVVPVTNGSLPTVAVKTNRPVAKEKIFEVMKVLQNFQASAPLEIGDVLISNAANTGSDIIVTRAVSLK